MTKILFIQGIHNFGLGERFIKNLAEATGLAVAHFPLRYGLWEHDKHQELVGKVEAELQASDDRFIILAHSFGGILAHCLSDAAYAKVDKIVTLASPHGAPGSLLRSAIGALPYRARIPVKDQRSYGFFFDPIVPFFVTRDPNAGTHASLPGTHTSFAGAKAFLAEVCR